LDLQSGTRNVVLRLRESAHGLTTDRTHYDISRDNRYVAYLETVHTHSKPSAAWHLIVVDIPRGKTVFKQSTGGPVLFPVSFSPDGTMLAVICGEVGTPTLRVVRLSDGRAVLSSIPAYNNSVSWSPDGSQAGVTDVWVRPVLIRLADKKRDVLPGRGSPRWSPNGKFISVDSMLWLVRERRMVKLKLPEHAIVTGWTPDSKALLYTQEDALKRYPLYVYDIGSNKVSKVMADQGGSDTYPTVWRR
jgi:Tol biopolymer transport system component